MLGYLSNFIAYAPTVYFALNTLGGIVYPSQLLSKYKTQLLVSNLSRNLFPDLHEKEKKLRKDIYVIKTSDVPHAEARGTNFGPSALMRINETLLNIDKEALNFICKHEIAHIKNNDAFVAPLIGASISFITAYALPFFRSRLPQWLNPIVSLSPWFVGTNIYYLALHIFELRADAFARKHASIEELQGFRRYLISWIKTNQKLSEKYPAYFSKEGDLRQNASHPPFTYRLECIEKVLKEKNVELKEINEEALKSLKEFHKDFYRTFAKLQIE